MTKCCIHIYFEFHNYRAFPHGSAGNQSVCNAGDTGDAGSIPGSGKSPEVGNCNPLQYPCLDNPRGWTEEPGR